MKKILALILALTFVLALASCGAKDDAKETETNANTTVDTTVDTDEYVEEEFVEDEVPAPTTDTGILLNNVWATYSEDEMFFPMMGEFEITDAESIDATLGFPQAELDKITENYYLIHGMNANTFTGAAYKMADGVDSAALVEAIKTNIMGRRWMCGFPETLIIIEADGCLITAFGNGEIIENFKTKTLDAIDGAALVLEEPIA